MSEFLCGKNTQRDALCQEGKIFFWKMIMRSMFLNKKFGYN
jgi:hypothetical protein